MSHDHAKEIRPDVYYGHKSAHPEAVLTGSATESLRAKQAREQSDRFEIKDSGKRESFSTGMVRDVQDGKVLYSLVLDGPMFERWAIHLTKGAKKYAARNWMLAETEEEFERAKESALRHFVQWFRGDRDEDHGSAVFFNINLAEYIRERLDEDARGNR